ncbi:hypothetical protein [Comamonas sp.]|uniref:hypothetical protein n=1 Tax=Comamonas sp. TaxID=34028 RepID=UPI0028A07002|nr:hypothetical protein [Comamonas sp.]
MRWSPGPAAPTVGAYAAQGAAGVVFIAAISAIQRFGESLRRAAIGSAHWG